MSSRPCIHVRTYTCINSMLRNVGVASQLVRIRVPVSALRVAGSRYALGPYTPVDPMNVCEPSDVTPVSGVTPIYLIVSMMQLC